MIFQHGLFPFLQPAQMVAAMAAGLVLGIVIGWLDAWQQRRTARLRTSLLYRNLARTNIELFSALAELQSRGQIEHEMVLWVRDQLSEQKLIIERMRPTLAKEAR